ncbi:MAG: hypothetical protein IT280_10715 [Ignavibacteria bacterium]|nr:hypothetical protein [Ignavibacteria bacterium]
MFKILFKIFSVLLLLMLCLNVKAQDTTYIIKVDTIKTEKSRILTIVKSMTVPKFIIHFNGGFNSGAMELTSHNGGFSRNDFLTGKNFGARNGYGFNLIGKLPLEKKGHFWLDFISGFDRFESNLIAKNTEEGKVSYNSFNGGVGIEYNFTPTHKIKYFLGINPLLSVISGKSELINPDNNRVEIKITSSLRLGYQVFLGLESGINKDFGFNFGLRFTHANLLLKKSETPFLDESVNPPITEVGLNDDAPPEIIEYAAWKQFAYFTVSAGVSYFFGVKEKRYKLPDK